MLTNHPTNVGSTAYNIVQSKNEYTQKSGFKPAHSLTRQLVLNTDIRQICVALTIKKYNLLYHHFLRNMSYSLLNPCRRHCPWVVSCPLHTWECPGSRVEYLAEQRAAQLLSLLGDCSWGPALSDGRGWSSELRPEKHNLPVWTGSQTTYKGKRGKANWNAFTWVNSYTVYGHHFTITNEKIHNITINELLLCWLIT